jgi:hypothetical protein
VHGAALRQRIGPHEAECLLQPRRAVDDNDEVRRRQTARGRIVEQAAPRSLYDGRQRELEPQEPRLIQRASWDLHRLATLIPARRRGSPVMGIPRRARSPRTGTRHKARQATGRAIGPAGTGEVTYNTSADFVATAGRRAATNDAKGRGAPAPNPGPSGRPVVCAALRRQMPVLRPEAERSFFRARPSVKLCPRSNSRICPG